MKEKLASSDVEWGGERKRKPRKTLRGPVNDCQEKEPSARIGERVRKKKIGNNQKKEA